METTLDIQRGLLSLGYGLGKAGADGRYGGKTRQAIGRALADLAAFRGAVEALPAPGRQIHRQAFYAVVRNQGLFGGALTVWLGRGLVQLTHRANYATMSAIIGVDLVAMPGYAMNTDIAVEIMIEGMTRGASLRGDFTGNTLEDYFNETTEDWHNARRIINGVESADKVAGYGKDFHAALKAAS